MKILITGGAGFVGVNLALYLRKRFTVFCIDNLQEENSKKNLSVLKDAGIRFSNRDIAQRDFFADISHCNLIIHAAADPAVLVSDSYSVISSNLIGTANCLELAKRDRADFIFISTNRVYPVKNNIRSLYGATKICSEYLIAEYADMFKFRYIINRCAAISGPFQRGRIDQGFVGYWIKQHLTGGNLSYIGFGGKGKQVRDVLHIDDLCRLIEIQINSIQRINKETFDVGGGKENAVSLAQLTAMVQAATGKIMRIGSVKRTRMNDIEKHITDNSHVTKLTGWKPEKTIIQTVQETTEWMKGSL